MGLISGQLVTVPSKSCGFYLFIYLKLVCDEYSFSSQIWSQNPSSSCAGDDFSVQKWQVTESKLICKRFCCDFSHRSPCEPFSPSLSDSLKDKLRAILKATYTHSRNLAYFVFTYKGLLALQEKMQGKSSQFHVFLAACVGGYLVFGDNNNINSQVRHQT